MSVQILYVVKTLKELLKGIIQKGNTSSSWLMNDCVMYDSSEYFSSVKHAAFT